MHWLVSLPLTGSKDDTWSSLQQLATYNAPLAECHKFSIPELRVHRPLSPSSPRMQACYSVTPNPTSLQVCWDCSQGTTCDHPYRPACNNQPLSSSRQHAVTGRQAVFSCDVLLMMLSKYGWANWDASTGRYSLVPPPLPPVLMLPQLPPPPPSLFFPDEGGVRSLCPAYAPSDLRGAQRRGWGAGGDAELADGAE